MCIEREQPSTAFKPMPAYGALNSSFKAASQPVDAITKVAVDADSNDVAFAYEVLGSDGVTAVTVLVVPVAACGEDQIDLILNYTAFDGASMIETYEATRADA